jgi:hypothetical protein
MKCKLIGLATIIIFVSVVAVSYAYALDKRDKRIIEIAYQNGFQQAMKLDPEIRRRIKGDHSLIEQEAIRSSQQYMQVVDDLNK